MDHSNAKPGVDAAGPRDAVSAGERNGTQFSNYETRKQGFWADKLERARSALAYIDPHAHDTWFKVGMGLKAEFGEEAWPIFDDWSRPAENYDAKENRNRWRSFKPGGGITNATLYRMACDAGWRDDGIFQVPDAEELAERARARAEAAAGQRERDDRAAAETAKKADVLWSIAGPAQGDNPYCLRKGVTPTKTLREIDARKTSKILGYHPRASGETLCGKLLAVSVERDGKLSSLQLIDGDGRKHFLAGGAVGGGYWAAQPLPEGDGSGVSLLLGEGVATVLSARQAMPRSLGLAAMSNKNMPVVARQMWERYPAATIIVLADLDKKSGEPDKYAAEAAGAVDAGLAVPKFGQGPAPDRKDFNDMARVHGVDAVLRTIEGAGASVQEGRNQGRDAAAAWPDLVPLHGGQLPTLPAYALGGWLGDYASALAEATEVPFELTGAMVLGATSVATARRIRLLVKEDYVEPLNLWLLPSLAPGNRKSAVERLAAGPLREWERDQTSAMKAEIEEAEAAAKVANARAKELRGEAAKTKDDAKAREFAEKALELERVWQWIERRRLAEFQARDAWQGLKGSGAFARMADVTGALEILEERGYVRSEAIEINGGGRRPSPRYTVRPDLARGWRP